MKIDTAGQTIRRLAREQGYLVEVEQITDIDGTARRFWFFFTGRGQPLIDAAGVGLEDQAALMFLQHGKQ